MQIIKGCLAHLDDIVRLNRVVQNFHVQKQPRYFRPFDEPAIREFMRAALNDPSVTVLLAVEGAEALGYAMLRLHEREGHAYALPRRFLELEQIAVAPDSCRRGVGAALMDEAVAVAKSLGVCDLELSVWRFNRSAQQLFRRKGLQPYLQRMRIQVP